VSLFAVVIVESFWCDSVISFRRSKNIKMRQVWLGERERERESERERGRERVSAKERMREKQKEDAPVGSVFREGKMRNGGGQSFLV